MQGTVWKIKWIAPNDSAQGLCLSTLGLVSAGTRVEGSATLTCAITPNEGSLAALTDGDSSTVCGWSRAATWAGTFDLTFTFATAVTIDTVVMAGPARGRFPRRIYVECDGKLAYTMPGLKFGGANTESSYPGVTFNSWAKTKMATDELLDVSGSGITWSPVGTAPTNSDDIEAPNGRQMVFAATPVMCQSDAALQAQLSPGTGDFCFETWVKTTQFGERTLFDCFYTHADLAIRAQTFQFSIVDGVPGIYHNSTYLLKGTRSVNNGNWVHVAYNRRSSVLGIYVNGVKVGTVASTLVMNVIAPVALGGQSASRNAAYDFTGSLANPRFVVGDAVYYDYFTPDRCMFPGMAIVPTDANRNTPFPHTVEPKTESVPGLISAVRGVVMHRLRWKNTLVNDVNKGLGTVTGTVNLAGPPLKPVRKRVRLFRSMDGLLIAETMSALDGSFTFNYVPHNYEYDVIAWDNDRNYRSVIANNITPDKMT